jgi:cyclopropane fatty-acyl-phospholipid synthase-like methyltransferase
MRNKTDDLYSRQLTRAEIASGEHRKLVGGLWLEIGALQLEFLLQQGLLPGHKLVDIGCGALRCGIPIIRYLDAGNYHGLDINASLIEAGKYELAKAGLTAKSVQLVVSDRFEINRLGSSFDFAIAQSLFSHLDKPRIAHCLAETRGVLRPGAKFFCTFFLAPQSGCAEPIQHQPGGVITFSDRDPFHYSVGEMEWLAHEAGFSAKFIGDWAHPRNLQMLQLSSL